MLTRFAAMRTAVRAMRPARRMFAMRRARSARTRTRAGIELNGGDGTLVDALQPHGRAQHHQVLIERLDASGQANAIDEINFDALALFARSVHEVVLRVRFCGRHGRCVWKNGCSPGFYIGPRARALFGRTDAHYNGLWTRKHPLNTMCNVTL